MALYDGNVGYWCCGPDAYPGWCDPVETPPACGSCNNFLVQCSWPKLGDTGCNYTDGCLGQIEGWCGQLINVCAWCYERTIFDVPIVDCGPDQNYFCWEQSHDCLWWRPPLADLSPAAFSLLAPMEMGRISVTVETHF